MSHCSRAADHEVGSDMRKHRMPALFSLEGHLFWLGELLAGTETSAASLPQFSLKSPQSDRFYRSLITLFQMLLYEESYECEKLVINFYFATMQQKGVGPELKYYTNMSLGERE